MIAHFTSKKFGFTLTILSTMIDGSIQTPAQ